MSIGFEDTTAEHTRIDRAPLTETVTILDKWLWRLRKIDGRRAGDVAISREIATIPGQGSGKVVGEIGATCANGAR